MFLTNFVYWMSLHHYGYVDCKSHANLELNTTFSLQGPLSCTFPIENRQPPSSLQALKGHLERTKNKPYVKRISDFHLLLLLSNYLDVNTDVPQLTEAIHLQGPVPDGYQLIIESLASNF